ncbi:MAG: M50 family metallopeptidase [Armatimonadetes bacterium]|nr:M50 family metallopeptidase [Armatimonadota bacterium]
MKRYPPWIFVAILLAIVLVLTLMVTDDFGRALFSWLMVCFGVAVMTAALYLLLILSVLFHELGHLAVAWCVGRRLGHIDVGPFRISREPKEQFLSWRKEGAAMMRGFCVTHEGARPTTKRGWQAKIAGGPLATLLLIVAGLVLALTPNNIGPKAWIPMFGGAVAIVNVILLLGSLSTNKASDLSLFLAAGRVQDWGASNALTRVHQSWAQGHRARDWDQALIDRGSHSSDVLIKTYALTLDYYRSLDTGQPERALARIEEAASIAAEDFPHAMVWEEVAFARAYLKRDLPGAEAAWKLVNQDRTDSVGQRDRAWAALMLLKGELPSALVFCEKAREWVMSAGNLDKANVQAELEWIDHLQADIETSMSDSSQGQIQIQSDRQAST